MRAAIVVLLLVIFSPISASFAENSEPSSQIANYEKVLPSFSKTVQLAFERVSDLDIYNDEYISEVRKWLVVTGIPIEDHHTTEASPIESEETLLKGAYIWTFDDPSEVISRLSHTFDLEQIESFSPIIEEKKSLRFEPNDPYFADQWHLNNSGQSSPNHSTAGTLGEDANITGAWDKYNGSGVIISIIDDGLDGNHSDLQPHFSSSLSYDWCNDDGDPSPTSTWNSHGTAVAGVAAAVGNNSIDVTGAAFGATLAGSTLIACGTSDSLEAEALSYFNNDIDIYTNSWGPWDDGTRLEGPGPLTIAAIEDSIYNGRNGLGNIYTWAAGNGLASNDNSNYDGYANSRYTIAVTAIDHNGEQSWYAEPGANILVAAHSDGDDEGITTTDISGSWGYNSGDVTHDFGGTSSATPLAAGVIALILEANPNLNWRDVQNILVDSARMNDVNDSSWLPNGGGHMVSHKYGFGAVDAGAAVLLAENWTSSGEEVNASFGPFSPNTDLEDDANDWTEFSVDVPVDISLESVDVVVDIAHTNRGDLEIVLESPSGYNSWLAEQHLDTSDDYNSWMFSTVHHWDEASQGEWKLKIRDAATSNTGTLVSWELIFHGVGNISDFDNDGWPDYNDADDDNDGWDDQDEESCGTDPFNSSSFPSDLDQDGVCNLIDADDDNDGFNDSYEIPCNTDPLNSTSFPGDNDLDGICDFIDDDDDNDGLSDFNETEIYGTDPLDYDSDDDGLNDFQEVITYGTEANQSDSDNDNISDFDEVIIYGTNPLISDSDGDGISDGTEVFDFSSDPLSYDFDNDSDGWYSFQDCEDMDFDVYPDRIEDLDNKDNDCDGLVDEGFNGSDLDSDGLSDWEEYHIFGTNHTNQDTDGDGLNDSTEAIFLGTDPVSPDLDTDGDGFYWFEDCDDNNSMRSPDLGELLDNIDNDCDHEIDEDFKIIDSDNDGLTDFEEFHNFSTDPNDGDSDDDGLPDGVEVNDLDSNPLDSDPDDDSDGWYSFQDCDDNDFEVAPDKQEKLDGKDNDCDQEIDEDFKTIDTDGDLIWDYDEFHNYSTDYESADSDEDGLDDGSEILVKMSDPLKFDYDRDLDGYYEFEDCDDSVPSIFPGAEEIWNGVDDDCDQIEDEGLDRLSLIGSNPDFLELVIWDSANETLQISIQGVPNNIDMSVIWTTEGFDVGTNSSLNNLSIVLERLYCKEGDIVYSHQLCEQGDSLQEISAVIIDSGETTEVTWNVSVLIWIEPDSSEGILTAFSESFGIFGVVLLIISSSVLGVILAIRISERRRLQDALDAYGVTKEQLSVRPEKKGISLPSAPEIPGLMKEEEDY